MKILTPFEVPSYRQPEVIRLQSKIGVDLTQLICLTCDHWDDLLIVDPDILNEITQSFVDRHLSQFQGFRTSVSLARDLRYVMSFIYGQIHPYVDDVAQTHMPNESVLLRMLGWQCRGLILELSPRPIEKFNPNEPTAQELRRRVFR